MTVCLTADQSIIFGMGTNPDPNHNTGFSETQGTVVVVADSHSHQILATFEPAISQRRAIGVCLPELVVF
jgi:hypothetical protein